MSFATIGAMTVVQDLIEAAQVHVTNADPELVSEETLCLVSTATARSICGIGAPKSIADPASSALLNVPFSYRDYLLGFSLLVDGDQGVPDRSELIGSRIDAKMAFYSAHLEDRVYPLQRAIENILLLWMGRISPPGLPDSPEARLGGTGATDLLTRHLRLIASFVRHSTGAKPVD